MKLYGRKSSINVMKAAWTLGELGIAAERIDEDGSVGSIDTPEYRAINPHAIVPTLDDDWVIVMQSNTIVRYLAAKYSDGDLWPADPAGRAEADRGMDWQATEVWFAMTPVFWGLVRTPPEKRDMAKIQAGIEGLAGNFTILNDHLAGRDYFAGDHFTMGDIPLGAACYRYYAMEIERPALPHVEAWYARLQERAPYREFVMLPLV